MKIRMIESTTIVPNAQVARGLVGLDLASESVMNRSYVGLVLVYSLVAFSRDSAAQTALVPPNACASPPTAAGFVVARILDAKTPASGAGIETRLLTIDKGTSAKLGAGMQGYVLSCDGRQLPVGTLQLDAVRPDGADATLSGALPDASLKGAWVAIGATAAGPPPLPLAAPPPPQPTWTARRVLDIQPNDQGRSTRITFARGNALPYVSGVAVMTKLGGASGIHTAINVETVTGDQASAILPVPPSELGASGSLARFVYAAPGKTCTFAPAAFPPAGPIDSRVWASGSVGAVTSDAAGAATSTLMVSVELGSSRGFLPGVVPVVALSDHGLTLQRTLTDVAVVEAGWQHGTVRIRNAPSALYAQRAKLRVYYQEAKCN
ncbi:hypothetical protein BH09MYX1_BH09MYX1_03130 [soil metagenome]